ncbi:MAG: hypothetical protein V1855_03480 [bacterium]
MKKIVPHFLFDVDGNKTGVLLKKADFETIMEAIEDYYDYKLIKKRTTKEHKTYTLEEVLAELHEKK